ncbi:MAG: acyltransferase [Burkholderiales bacterium]|nr:acyltransferase [Burkholderiales bacterium]
MARVALAQFSGNIDKEKNLDKALGLACEAARNGAKLICFPELCTTVYMPFENDARHFASAEEVPGPAVNRMARVARETGTVVVFPLFERAADGYYNAAVVLGPEGQIIGKYRKSSIPTTQLIPGGSERFYFKPGDLGYPVFETPFGLRIGIIICYERNAVEPARCIGLAGADVLFVPVATVAVTRPWWEVLLRAHAIHNLYYVAACNKVGFDIGGAPDEPYYGRSMFIDPGGRVMAQASETEDEIIYADLEPSLVREARRRWTFYEDRRPELYGAIVSKTNRLDGRRARCRAPARRTAGPGARASALFA